VGSYHKEGEEFEYSGPKNKNLEPVKQAKPEAAIKEPAMKETEIEK